MAYIKKRSADHLLIAYRPMPGLPEERWRCPDEVSFERFAAFEAEHKRSRPGVPVPDPGPLFGEAKATRGRKPKSNDEVAPPDSVRCFTLREWLGTQDRPGPCFQHAVSMRVEHRSTYFTALSKWAVAIASKPMDQVDVHDVNRVRDSMLVCEPCLERAEAAGRTDLTRRPWVHLLATEAPWDGPGSCVDEDKNKTHYPRLQKRTRRNYLGVLKAAWNRAIEAGQGKHPAERRCVGIVDNPFSRSHRRKADDRPDNDDDMQALTHAQVERYEAAMPPELACSITLSVHGMLRREELLGLDRSCIDWSQFPETRTAVVRVGLVLRTQTGLSRSGKTEMSTGHPIYLTAVASERLREHLDRFRSTPDPERCEACAAGRGSHYEQGANPHRHCPMADDAALFVHPHSGNRPSPGAYSGICARASERADLTRAHIGFKVTHKVLRATGATMLLEANVPIETVQRMGRWSNIETLRRHYHRIRDRERAEAAAALDAQARGELGLAPISEMGPADQVRYLKGQVAKLENLLAVYVTALDEHGVDADALIGKPVKPVLLRPQPGERWRRQMRHPSRFDDDDLLRQCVRESRSRAQVLVALGMTPATKNYRRLEERAAELGIELPPKLRRAS